MECRKCGKIADERAFATYRDRKGNLRRRGECQHCRSEYHRKNFEKLQEWRRDYNKANRSKSAERSARLRAEAKKMVDDFKSRPCVDCGATWPPIAMDLDHAKGEKFRNISALVSQAYRLELIKVKLEKCEVVCACCHRLRFQRRNEGLAPSMLNVPSRSRTGSSRSPKKKVKKT